MLSKILLLNDLSKECDEMQKELDRFNEIPSSDLSTLQHARIQELKSNLELLGKILYKIGSFEYDE